MDASKRGEHPGPKRGGVKRATTAKATTLERFAERVKRMPAARRERLAAHLDAGPPLSEQLRLAVDGCGQSRYAICKATGIDQGHFSRFMSGTPALSLTTLDTLCAYLRLELRKRRRLRTGDGRR